MFLNKILLQLVSRWFSAQLSISLPLCVLAKNCLLWYQLLSSMGKSLNRRDILSFFSEIISCTSDGISLENPLIVRSRPSGSGNHSVHKRTFVERTPQCVEILHSFPHELFRHTGWFEHIKIKILITFGINKVNRISIYPM